MGLKDILFGSKIRVLLVLMFVIIILLFPKRSAYYDGGGYGSTVGSLECPCYGYEYSSPVWTDSPGWKNCIGYVDKNKCECNVRNTSAVNVYCDFDKVAVEHEIANLYDKKDIVTN